MSDFSSASEVHKTKGKCYVQPDADEIARRFTESIGDLGLYDENETEALNVSPGTPIRVGDVEGCVPMDFFKPLRDDLQAQKNFAPDFSSYTDSQCTIRELDELTADEKYILQVAISRKTSKLVDGIDTLYVNLVTVLNSRRKLKAYKDEKKHTTYMSLYRAAERLQNRKIATVKRAQDGIIWIWIPLPTLTKLAAQTRQKMEAERERYIDLIRRDCEIPTSIPKGESQTKKKARPDPLAIPKNATQERLAAVKLTMGIKGEMDVGYKADISRLFHRYNDRVTEKIITMLDNFNGELLGSQYSTRFNDSRKARVALNKFDYAMEQSLKDYWRAALLTLTTDPKEFDSLWEANRSMAKSWNKFMAWLTKRNEGIRPEYIAAYEYTKSGLIHMHVILLMDWVAEKDEITKEWMKIGQGMINDVRGLRRQNLKGQYVWKWAKKRPNGSTAAHGGDYLKKYLKKATLAKSDNYDDQGAVQAPYWVYNKRFWSSSQRLLPPPEAEFVRAESENENEEPRFSFFKVLSEDEADVMVDRMIYWRGGENPNAPSDEVEVEL